MIRWFPRALVLFLISIPLAHSEYRVYKLRVVDQRTESQQAQNPPQRTITSTLDHIQYPSYYPLNPGETVEYVDSWMCWGNHSHYSPLCPNPRQQAGPLMDPEE